MPAKPTFEEQPTPEPSWDQLVAQFGQRRPEITLPGYWSVLEEHSAQWAKEMSVSRYWEKAKATLDQWRTEYLAKTGAELVTAHGLLDFTGKSADSIQEKILRESRRKKEKAESLFSEKDAPVPSLNDLVRTRVACSYIDGVEFLTSKMENLAKGMDLWHGRSHEGRLDGYFAQHLYVYADFIFMFGGSRTQARILCEIQVASALATNTWNALHPIYESSRRIQRPKKEWQWNPSDPEFIANQLRHMIHLADGLLVQLRDANNNRGEF